MNTDNEARLENNILWYDLMRHKYELSDYNEKIDYFLLYNKLNRENPLITNEELVQYYKEFSLIENIKLISDDILESDNIYEMAREIQENCYVYDYEIENLYEKEKHNCYKFRQYIEEQKMFKFHYFTFIRIGNDYADAALGIIPLTPENMEKLARVSLSSYPLLSDNIKKGYGIKINILKSEETIKSILTFHIVNDIVNLDNIPPFIIKEIEKIIKIYKQTPEKIKDKIYMLDEFTIKIKSRVREKYSSRSIAGPRTLYPYNKLIVGFTKKQIIDAILKSGLPTGKMPYIHHFESIKTEIVNPNYMDINIKEHLRRPPVLPGFSNSVYMPYSYYEILYRMLFKTIKNRDWKDLCELEPEYVIRYILANDFEYGEEAYKMTMEKIYELKV